MNFFYEAVDRQGHTVVGKMAAKDPDEVKARLRDEGCTPTTVAAAVDSPPALERTQVVVAPQAPSAAHARPLRPAGAPPAPDGGSASTRDLYFFFTQLASLSRSGISLYTALGDLANRTPNKGLARAAARMSEAARRGEQLSSVMVRFPGLFPEYVVGTVRAGELGGFVDVAIGEIAAMLEQNIAMYRGIWFAKAMALYGLAGIPFVIPVFPYLLPNGDVAGYLRALPLSLLASALLVLVAIGCARYIARPQFRLRRDTLALRLPVTGTLQREHALLAFIKSLRRLFHAGVGPIQAWDAAINAATNLAIRNRLSEARGLMVRGASLSDAFAATKLFANPIEQLVTTGVVSGEVVESLDRAERWYQQRVDEAAGKARFAMFRMGLLTLIIGSGIATVWFVAGYAHILRDFMNFDTP